jgi:cytochrome P450
MREIIAERKSKTFSESEDFDLLQTLLYTEMYKGREERIIDEIISMFLAGHKTVQLTTTNVLCYMKEYPEVGTKLQAEIDSKIRPIKDDIVGKFTKDLA